MSVGTMVISSTGFLATCTYSYRGSALFNVLIIYTYRWGGSVTKNKPGNRNRHWIQVQELSLASSYTHSSKTLFFYVTVFTNTMKTRFAYVYILSHIILH